MITTENQASQPALNLEYELAHRISTHIQPSNLPHLLQQFVRALQRFYSSQLISDSLCSVMRDLQLEVDQQQEVSPAVDSSCMTSAPKLQKEQTTSISESADVPSQSQGLVSNPYLKSLSEKGFNKVYAR